ncbi:MAG: hypothetical protein JWN48_1994 [Myxococcaceae bacterium]|nr:hypothetical protein [Myxococcaceae bacterium]
MLRDAVQIVRTMTVFWASLCVCSVSLLGCGKDRRSAEDAAAIDGSVMNDGSTSSASVEAGKLGDGAPTVEGARDAGSASALANTSFGFVGVEPIIEDGSKKGLAIAPNLVERMDELSAALPLLQEAKVSLVMIVQDAKLESPTALDEVFELVEDAARRGLEVRPAPVLSADDGYYPNATNVGLFVTVVRKLVTQWQARGLPPSTLVVDMEPPRELTAALAAGDYGNASPDDHIDRPRYEQAIASYAALAEELHRLGWKVAVTTQATLLADYDDGDDDMRQYFNVVLDGVAWDQVEFQLYRSAFASISPGLDSYFVYYAARKALAQFAHTSVGIGLGLTHPGPIFPDSATEDATSLQADLQAAVAAGIRREGISVYNLKGILLGPPFCDNLLPCRATEYVYHPNDPRSWFIDVSGGVEPPDDGSTALLWSQFQSLDSALDP